MAGTVKLFRCWRERAQSSAVSGDQNQWEDVCQSLEGQGDGSGTQGCSVGFVGTRL